VCSKVTATDGSKYDLSWFTQQGTHPPMKGTTGGDIYKYEFQVCGTGFSCGTVACSTNNAGSCQSWADFMTPGSQACAGQSAPQNLLGLPDGKGVSLSYVGGDTYQGNARKTNINLNCAPDETGWGTVFFDDSRQSELIFTVTISSPHACPGGGGSEGLSGGSVILIILVVVIPIYLVGGMVFNKVRRNATGVELIPNLEFWKVVPGLVKDGFLFIIRRGQGSYANV